MLSTKDFAFKKTVFVFFNRRETMAFRNDNLIIKDADGKVKFQASCYRLFIVFIVGDGHISSGLLRRAKKFGFHLILMNYSFRIYSVIQNPAQGNTILCRKQYQYDGTEIAQWICREKVSNQLRTLKKLRQSSLHAQEQCTKLTEHLDKISKDRDLNSLLGLEGSAAKLYFRQIFAEDNWQGRKPRIKHDINNCLLDIGYTLLFSLVEAILNCYGFDLYVGFYHQIYYQRKSLACDLVEPFRCIIDYKIRKMNRLKMIDPDDFVVIQGRYQLQYKKAEKYISCLLSELLKYKDEIFVFIQSFYRAFMKDKAISEYPSFKYN